MFKLAVVAAVLALPQAAAAQADACLTKDDVRTLVAFAGPSVIDAATQKCAATLPADSFLRSGGPAMAERLRGERGADPQALIALINKISDDKVPPGLSEGTMESLVDDVLGAEITGSIEAEDCGAINHLMSALQSLSAADIAAIFSGLILLGGSDDEEDEDPFRMCEG